MTEGERRQYEETKKIMGRILHYKAGVYEPHNTFSMFQAILQLRILCNHGTFQQLFALGNISQRDVREADNSDFGHAGQMSCSICKLPIPFAGIDQIHNSFLENCSHIFCSECLEISSNSDGLVGSTGHCPLCERMGTLSRKAKLLKRVNNSLLQDLRMDFGRLESTSEEDDDKYFRLGGYSSKMEALMRDVSHDLWSTKRYCYGSVDVKQTWEKITDTVPSASFSHVGHGR